MTLQPVPDNTLRIAVEQAHKHLLVALPQLSGLMNDLARTELTSVRLNLEDALRLLP